MNSYSGWTSILQACQGNCFFQELGDRIVTKLAGATLGTVPDARSTEMPLGTVRKSPLSSKTRYVEPIYAENMHPLYAQPDPVSFCRSAYPILSLESSDQIHLV